MPYRRLPNTDLARLHALQNAIQQAQSADYTEQVIPYKVLSEVQRFLVPFENIVMQSKDNYKSTVNANKQYRHIVQNARMYISHFIQVLNLAVIRGEIKREQKLLYGLDPHQHVVPDLSTEEYILEWGKKIIDGEQKRMANGGFPIYNPAINKVKVHYEGRLLDGTVFDSSYKRGEPSELTPKQVIKGWTEALTMMPEGSKWQLYIPYDLAYGDREAGQIKPYSMLIFDVELIEIVTK